MSSFGGFRELQEFPTAVRTDEHKRKDLVLYLFILLHRNGWNFVPVPLLHIVWGNYLRFLRRKGVEYGGFYQNCVTGDWCELDDAILEVRLLKYAGYFEFTTDRNLMLTISESSLQKIEERADPAEWAIIKESLQYFIRRMNKVRIRRWP